MKGKCPFGKVKCEECVLYRRGMRYWDDGRPPVPMEECAIVIAVDCLENLVNRSIGQQKATEQTRNAVTAFTELLGDIANAKNSERSGYADSADIGRAIAPRQAEPMASKLPADVSRPASGHI